MNSLKDFMVSNKRIFSQSSQDYSKKETWMNLPLATSEWKTLATKVPELSTEPLIQSYIIGLKPHIQNGLKLHDITTIEVAIRKAKVAEKKSESSLLPIYCGGGIDSHRLLLYLQVCVTISTSLFFLFFQICDRFCNAYQFSPFC
jgi:hypothetical protein